MARPKKKATTTKTAKRAVIKTGSEKRKTNIAKASRRSQNLFEELKLSESYVSLLLGVVVVFVLSAVFFMFVKGTSLNGSSDLSAPKQFPTQTTLQSPRTYTLKEGEGLWDVAVKYFGDGYKWVDIAKANNLTEQQAGQLGPGSKIIIPNLK